MNTQIYYHRYSLVSKEQLNVKSARVHHEGVLLKIGEGYGCIHPWRELGDLSVDEQLAVLKRGGRTRLSIKARYCAKLDAEARKDGLSLFTDLDVPKSHAILAGNIEEVEGLKVKGFDTLKIKAGFSVKEDVGKVNELVRLYPNIKIRVDFNCNFSANEVESFLKNLSQEARTQIDFLEDPCRYNESVWHDLRNLYGIRLAMDMEVEKNTGVYGYAVIKPAKNNVKKVMEMARKFAKKTVVTSYMDHPIGQAFAAYQAGIYTRLYPGLMAQSGLMTHQLFESNIFSEALGDISPKWNYTLGSGLGFDKELDEIPWKKLI